VVIVLRSHQRRYLQQGREKLWHSFYSPDHPAHLEQGFGALVALDENRLPPGNDTMAQVDHETEIVSYVRRGALSQADPAGDSLVIQAGEFQVMSTGRRMRRRERSVSQSDGLHIFRMTFRPSEVGLARAQEHKRFTAAQRRRQLCVVASPDGRGGSLRIHQDAIVISSVLDSGHHVVHILEPGRSAWLHIVSGETTLQDILLIEGDGAGITDEPSVSLTACVSTEVLLIDVGSSTSIRVPETSPREHPVKGDPT
jgi:redox-sensitive bicupin YhaK (pirin superfamily)